MIAAVARPQGEGPFPAIVLLHGTHGFAHEYVRLAQAIAWGMAALAPHTKWISLGCLRGSSLDDPDKLLEGTGASVGHIQLRSQDELVARRAAIKRLLKAAAELQPR